MSRGSAIIGFIIAFVGGVLIGHVTGSSSSSDTVAAAGEGADTTGAAAAAGDIERYKIPVTGKAPQRGSSDALVTIIEFSDFQCPFCGRVEPTLAQLRKEYGNKIRLVWHNNPLPMHQYAMGAAEAAMEAYAQGGNAKFWQMHDLLFKNQRNLTRADLEKYAQQVGLNMAKFKKALDTNAHQAEIKQDQALAAKVGARGTPAFFIDGRNLMGAQPPASFKKIIDDEIKRAKAVLATGVKPAQVYAALTRNGKTEKAAPTPNQPNQPQKVPDQKAVYKVPIGNAPVRGPSDALVTIVEFSDFQCPFCGRAEGTIKQVLDTYGKDVRLVWKNEPLPFHPHAMPAANAAWEAYKEGGNAKFWKMHDLLFQNQQNLTNDTIEKLGRQVGLNASKLKMVLDTLPYKDEMERQANLGKSIGANGTPAFFINGRNLRGAQPFQSFKIIIDQELAKAKAKVASGTPRSQLYASIIKNGATTPQFVNAPSPSPSAQQKPDANKKYDIPIPADSPWKGGAHAKVVIQEFSDFQCPFCGRVEPTVEQFLKEYGNKIHFVWRNYPLPMHPNAMPAAEAAWEVYKQGGMAKFWQYHDILFKNQRELTRDNLEKWAQQIGGINMAKFKKALDTNAHQARIKQDQDAITKAGAHIGTPSFFINGHLVQGAQPYPQFKAAIDKALQGG